MENGQTVNVTAVQKEAKLLLDALRKTEAVLSQLQDKPEQASDILKKGYFGHALVRARAALTQAG